MVVQTKAKGVHEVTAKLADGTERTYCYAWRGGPRIKAEKDTREFMAEYLRLTRGRERRQFTEEGSLAELIQKYCKSKSWTGLKPSTRAGYQYALDKIEIEFGAVPIKDLTRPGARGAFIAWRDEIAEETPRMADMTMSVLQAIFTFAVDREHIPFHPLEKVGKVSDGSRRDIIWTPEDIAAFKAAAPECMVRALMLGMWTGQRQGDLLHLPWSAYDGESITVPQSKTNTQTRVAVSAELRECLERAPISDVGPILTTQDGKPWKSGFKSSWRKAVDQAGIRDRTFHDLRGTFVTLAYRNGASIRDISEVTGHSEKDADRIIRKHYLVSRAAVRAIETGTECKMPVKGVK